MGRRRLPARAISIRLSAPDLVALNRDRARLGYPTRSSCIRSAILNFVRDADNATGFVQTLLERQRRIALLIRAEVADQEQAMKLVNQLLQEIDAQQQRWMSEKAD